MTKLIKVQDNVYSDLTGMKRDGETYSEVIYRLIILYQLLKKVKTDEEGE